MWQKIYDLNKSKIGDSPARLKLGTVLDLPSPPTQRQ
jgi:nucleoid-associated protein YgaU